LLTATAVEKKDEGRYAADLDPVWRIGTKANGGYLTAITTRAAVDAAGRQYPHPEAVSTHFLSAPRSGQAEVVVETLRRGRSTAQLRATMLSDGERVVESIVTCGRLRRDGSPYWSGVAAPVMPPIEECSVVGKDGPGGIPLPIFGEVELRLDPATAGFAVGRPSRKGMIQGWVRISPEPPDPYALLVALDVLPPATFELGLLGSWVPTLELTAHLRALPSPGPLRVRHRARVVTAGRVDEECDVWDAEGTLVGSARQLAAVRIPGEDGS
jgi:hypothetical protein